MKGAVLYIYIYIYTHIYIYIYIYIICVCIYIYTHIVCVYIYIYDPKRDPNLENFPYGHPASMDIRPQRPRPRGLFSEERGGQDEGNLPSDWRLLGGRLRARGLGLSLEKGEPGVLQCSRCFRSCLGHRGAWTQTTYSLVELAEKYVYFLSSLTTRKLK